MRRILEFGLILAGMLAIGAEPQARPAEGPPALSAQLGKLGARVTAAAVTRHSVTLAQSVQVPDTPVAASAASCPAEMVLVEGSYCTEVRHECDKWLDDPKLPYARCAKYKQNARCVGQRVPMRYCIDRTEYTKPGESLPLNHQSFVSGSKICKSQGKRLCTESEWNFACEGEEMLPYPYGWSREAKCNQDREDLYEKNPRRQILKDNRMSAAELSECVSPFGVLNMAGNLDEPVLRENARYNPPYRNGLKGGWWMAARNRCRPATTKHDDHYNDIQVGVRCCAEAPGTTAPTG